jgi:L-ascorbate metabolism protein UlaG (beta-lactamase superfamily)
VTDVRLTHIGGPTVLIEVGGWRLLTDPTFDAPGRRYRFGWGTGSRKLAGPALTPEELGPLDAVLLSHDHHDDNLDPAGRALLPSAGLVITTESGARRLGGGARGLTDWQTTKVGPIEITATPCRHGPPLSHPLVGDVIGFSLRWEGQEHGALWISGDTVLYPGVREVATRIDVGTALVHLGGVQFPVTGPLRYTMTASQAVELLGELRPHRDPGPLRGLEALPPAARGDRARVRRRAGHGARLHPLVADRTRRDRRGLRRSTA